MENGECSAGRELPPEAGSAPLDRAPARSGPLLGISQPDPTSRQGVPAAVSLNSFELSEMAWMLRLARASVEGCAQGEPPPVVDSPPAKLLRKRACFVTLYSRGSLRGCIGSVQPLLPLYQAILENARAAASRDPRFSPVAAAELPRLKIRISVLTEPQPLFFDSAERLLSQLEPGTTGVLLRIGNRVGTFLPQVWREIPDPTEFLNRLAEKAGLPADAWRWPSAAISVYDAECFEEPDQPPVHN